MPGERWKALRVLLTQPFSISALHSQLQSLQADLIALAKTSPDAEGRGLHDLAETVGESTAPELFQRAGALYPVSKLKSDEASSHMLGRHVRSDTSVYARAVLGL